MPGSRRKYQRPCPVHGDQKHGQEAEELRLGVENILAEHDPELSSTTPEDAISELRDMRDALQRLLDETDARDSVAHLEAKAQAWISRDSWSGPEDEGASLHPTRAHLDAYVRAECGGRTGPAPEYYANPEGQPRQVDVDAALFLQVQAAGKSGHRLSALAWRELELEAELAEVRARRGKEDGR